MRKLFGLLAAVGLLVGTASSASAATLNLTGGVLGVSIGALPPITIGQSPASIPIAVSSGGGSFVEPAGVFAATVNLPTALFTGVPLISSLNVTASNGTKNVSAGNGANGGFGGPGGLNGTATVGVLGGLVNLLVPLAGAGGGGVVGVAAASLAVTVTGNIWTTGAVVITKITTTPDGAPGALNTVTYSGSDNRTAGHAGTIQLVAPLRILTNAAGNLPGLVTQTLNFSVPEPGTLLLIGSGVAGLALVGGRKRMRK